MIATFHGDPVPPDALLYAVRCSPADALRMLADIEHAYVCPTARPRLGAAVQDDGTVELWAWPRIHNIGALLLLLRRGGRPLRRSTIVTGTAWIDEARLGRYLAALAQPEEAAHAL